jgi:isopentenyldiphosphate isomerase
MPELFEVFDDRNQPLGYTKERHLVHREGDWHRTAQVYVLNARRELLCNLRHPDKDVFASLWDVCIGGHLAPGETYPEGAVREMGEELGVALQPADLRFVAHVSINGGDAVKGLFDREHAGVFVWQTDRPAEDFEYQREEISRLAFFPLAEVRRNLNAELPAVPFIPLLETYLRILDLVEKKIGNQ